MFRKLALSILIVLSVIAILPLADSAARGLGRSVSLQRRQHRRHSRRWWRRHRARMRARQAALAMAHRAATLTMKPVVTGPTTGAAVKVDAPALTNGWDAMPAGSNGDLKFRANGNASDQAALSVVALSRPAPAYLTHKEQRQMLSGVSFSELRRSVIDKMIVAGGWVNNDYEREVAGRRVFVVTAQTPADGRSPDKAWNFYFTEVNGRIYSLATEANMQSADRMKGEAEKFITSLR